MTFSLLLGLALFGFVCSITPGPNNTMLLASGANFGFWRTVPHGLGVTAGLVVQVIALGLGLGALFRTYPLAYEALRWLGAAYLLWLAFKLARAKGLGGIEGAARPMTFWEAAAFQAVNPKAWVIALTVATTYVSRDHFVLSLCLGIVVLALVNGSCIAVWTAFGMGVRRFLDQPGRLRAFNVSMAVLLVLSLYPLLQTAELPK
jgi:threonine/homoserine/homoserine lactone efflux protein